MTSNSDGVPHKLSRAQIDKVKIKSVSTVHDGWSISFDDGIIFYLCLIPEGLDNPHSALNYLIGSFLKRKYNNRYPKSIHFDKGSGSNSWLDIIDSFTEKDFSPNYPLEIYRSESIYRLVE